MKPTTAYHSVCLSSRLPCSGSFVEGRGLASWEYLRVAPSRFVVSSRSWRPGVVDAGSSISHFSRYQAVPTWGISPLVLETCRRPADKITGQPRSDLPATGVWGDGGVLLPGFELEARIELEPDTGSKGAVIGVLRSGDVAEVQDQVERI